MKTIEEEINLLAEEEIHIAIDHLIDEKAQLWEENQKLKRKIKRLEKKLNEKGRK